MSDFPVLKTGAVLQFPAERGSQYSTQVVRFIDGSEQRFRDFAQPIHRWIIRLDKVDETELNRLREFFRIRNGAAGEFQFVDPWDGTTYPSCCLETDQMLETLIGEFQGKTTLVVKENRT